jgi:hypothetical protein
MSESSDFSPLTDAQVEKIAEKAAERAVAKLTDRVYRDVGKNVVQKLFWIIGVVTIALYFWLQSKGLIK